LKNKLVYGVGINDADYVLVIYKEFPRTNGKQNRKLIWRCPFYDRWVAMLGRCYSKSYQEKHPSYKGCSVCEEWLTFSNFKAWMEQQDWEGKQLDKDLLVYNNKVYSPETCVFIAPSINSFLLKRNKTRGIYPIGVCYHTTPKMINPLKRPYQAQIGNRGKKLLLGLYLTPEEAHKAWQKAKIKQAQDLAVSQTDERVIKGLQRVANKIQYDLDNNLETKDF
jgi:hypothetical protein